METTLLKVGDVVLDPGTNFDNYLIFKIEMVEDTFYKARQVYGPATDLTFALKDKVHEGFYKNILLTGSLLNALFET